MKIKWSRIRPSLLRRRGDRRVNELAETLGRLGIEIQDTGLLKRALIHRSHSAESNERLEFLGDAVLDLLVSEHLYGRFPTKDEGELTEMRAALVGKRILTECAEQISLKDHLFLGKSEMGLDARGLDSIMSDAYEALIAAIYLDCGLEAARRFVRSEILSRAPGILADKRNVNHKSELQHLAQAEGWGMPRYRVCAETGPHHRREFEVEVRIDGKVRGVGRGESKKVAEQRAAQQALRILASTRYRDERQEQ
jgi:ribonuclease-3